jgi:hypothetical protein
MRPKEIKLVVGPSTRHGVGVFTTEPISKGQVIDFIEADGFLGFNYDLIQPTIEFRGEWDGVVALVNIPAGIELTTAPHPQPPNQMSLRTRQNWLKDDLKMTEQELAQKHPMPVSMTS